MTVQRRRLFAFGVPIVFSVTTSMIVAEGSLRVARNPEPTSTAEAFARSTACTWKSVEIRARDGTPLRAWCFTSPKPRGLAVIALHGVADNRRGVLAHSRMLVENGYTVLAPDSRGHGESGPALLSYGLHESDDLRLWLDWVIRNERPQTVFALGESMGASVLLQTLAVERRFRAVVAECPFSSFRAIAYDRVGGRLMLNQVVSRSLLWPIVEPALVYIRARYDLDFSSLSPERAITNASTPVLLIHGTADRNIPPDHSRRLAAANSSLVTLWEPEGAGHTGAIGAYPADFRNRVLNFFAGH